MKYPLLIICLFYIYGTNAQNFTTYKNSTAIHKDSSIFVDWAKQAEINRGYLNISDTTFVIAGTNRATFGNDTSALGKADGTMGIVSLGDGGTATLFFDPPIINGEGYDFVIFENGFFNPPTSELAFLELAFVEISSDGKNFVRFPATSNTQIDNQLNAFGTINPENINNLAGKDIVNYGTPFDISILQNRNIETIIDFNYITHIKLIDVVGSINSDFCTYDSEGNIINDPFPTPYNSSGFDLDAVGVIHNTKTQNLKFEDVLIYPNPFNSELWITFQENQTGILNIYDLDSNKILTEEINQKTSKLNLSFIESGIYVFQFIFENAIFTRQIIKI